MKMTFRYYGLNDSIPLKYIKQIPNMSGVVTAIYDVPVGEIWPLASLINLKEECAKYDLKMEVIESIPVHEDIKLGKPSRDLYIANYIENIKRCASVGVKCICYNFMPVFDWLRTNLNYKNKDGSTSLSYDEEEFKKLDPTNLHLPGWDESYKKEELDNLLKEYKNISHDDLFNNYIYFLNKIIPVCEEYDVNMAVHPDDPPWDIFSLPRIVSNKNDLQRLFTAIPSKRNGLTLCTGSLGANHDNDLMDIAKTYAQEGRIHFLHARNILYLDNKAHGSFVESGHFDGAGSLDLAAIIKALLENGFDGYVRPDHGRMIFDEGGKPGYGLYDRALGSVYLTGLFEGLAKK